MKDLGMIQMDSHKPLRDIVFETLREAILEGKLTPGERVMEVQLAEQLGVSRTPVREAIRKLELEGLLVMVPRKGAYVADVSLKDVIDVLEVRASLEGLAASLGAERREPLDIELLEDTTRELIKCVQDKDTEGMIKSDAAFHDILLKASKNDKLTNIVEGLRDQVHRFRVIYFTEYEENAKKLIEEHEEILGYLRDQDTAKAQESAEFHIYNIRNFFIDQEK
ncbi:HTH-type transcriptional regulator LutR [Andreesenia angusta]|uniref:HTH-type transcriptional regulator LutR n=1 Tax=Andreesenia angusta TaxID=39480 RepID=A0A1S1V5P6_9FIRM|nr:GntR family transcriptional regulator [Andreesenia angusta]OHW61427.1 HTH-type transcriptional regulator LutR [Andreesenia angusta]